MVLYKQGDVLYKGITELVIENLNKLAQVYIVPKFPTGTKDATVRSSEDELLLKALKYVWDDHSSSLMRLGQILKYMVRPGIQCTALLTDHWGLCIPLGPRLYEISECSNDGANGIDVILQTYHQGPNQGPPSHCHFESSGP